MDTDTDILANILARMSLSVLVSTIVIMECQL